MFLFCLPLCCSNTCPIPLICSAGPGGLITVTVKKSCNHTTCRNPKLILITRRVQKKGELISSLILKLKLHWSVFSHCSFDRSEYSPINNICHHKRYQGDVGKIITCFRSCFAVWGTNKGAILSARWLCDRTVFLSSLTLLFTSDPALLISVF